MRAQTEAGSEQRHTPDKKQLSEMGETPEKTVLGNGVHKKAVSCKVCECQRHDEFFKGGSCLNCLKACRQLYGHQRVEDILSDPEKLSKVQNRSRELPALKAKKAEVARCQCDCSEVVAKLRGIEDVVSLLPRLKAMLERYEN